MRELSINFLNFPNVKKNFEDNLFFNKFALKLTFSFSFRRTEKCDNNDQVALTRKEIVGEKVT